MLKSCFVISYSDCDVESYPVRVFIHRIDAESDLDRLNKLCDDAEAARKLICNQTMLIQGVGRKYTLREVDLIEGE